MDCKVTTDVIVKWLDDYLNHKSSAAGFVVGISGGIDSAVVSTLCGLTGNDTLVLQMPIFQKIEEIQRAQELAEFLLNEYEVECNVVSLSDPFLAMKRCLFDCNDDPLAMANLRSRLRMCTLYTYATRFHFLVVGTGNKVEDFGVGFFTKYGDGGVDLSPIGRLTKTQVYELAAYLNVPESIQRAAPTDGLWEDARTDESQLGNTYNDLEAAMSFCEKFNIQNGDDLLNLSSPSMFSGNPDALKNYITRHQMSAHKMSMPPIGPEPIL